VHRVIHREWGWWDVKGNHGDGAPERVFAVTSRTKEIGTRRAIGARRADIVKMFLLENWLITTAGIVIGSVTTLAFAVQLHTLLELPRMPIVLLVGSMGLIWVAGLLAAWMPALRGSTVPPAVATRAA
jgi:putative ABC transport system permease protein